MPVGALRVEARLLAVPVGLREAARRALQARAPTLERQPNRNRVKALRTRNRAMRPFRIRSGKAHRLRRRHRVATARRPARALPLALRSEIQLEPRPMVGRSDRPGLVPARQSSRSTQASADTAPASNPHYPACKRFSIRRIAFAQANCAPRPVPQAPASKAAQEGPPRQRLARR